MQGSGLQMLRLAQSSLSRCVGQQGPRRTPGMSRSRAGGGAVLAFQHVPALSRERFWILAVRYGPRCVSRKQACQSCDF